MPRFERSHVHVECQFIDIDEYRPSGRSMPLAQPGRTNVNEGQSTASRPSPFAISTIKSASVPLAQKPRHAFAPQKAASIRPKLRHFRAD